MLGTFARSSQTLNGTSSPKETFVPQNGGLATVFSKEGLHFGIQILDPVLGSTWGGVFCAGALSKKRSLPANCWSFMGMVGCACLPCGCVTLIAATDVAGRRFGGPEHWWENRRRLAGQSVARKDSSSEPEGRARVHPPQHRGRSHTLQLISQKQLLQKTRMRHLDLSASSRARCPSCGCGGAFLPLELAATIPRSSCSHMHMPAIVTVSTEKPLRQPIPPDTALGTSAGARASRSPRSCQLSSRRPCPSVRMQTSSARLVFVPIL